MYKDELTVKKNDSLFKIGEKIILLIILLIQFFLWAIMFNPKIICIVTYAYGIGIKNQNIIDFLISKNYSIHADTFVNTIFIKQNTK